MARGKVDWTSITGTILTVVGIVVIFQFYFQLDFHYSLQLS
ncbi:hypothetical protein [[Eubacterium] cellulosolvens]